MRSHPSSAVPPTVPLQAAIYARVSSEQQAERHTIGSQLSDLQARAAQDGHRVRDDLLFVDDGHSGARLIRPDLERLRDLVASAAIDVVYVQAPDRLARSYAHQALLVEEFARAGTAVVFLNRPIGDTPEDNLLLQLRGMFAAYERTKMLERSRRGKRHLAKAGAVSVLSRAPFGYRYVSREAGGGVARFEINDDQAAVVRQIFRWVGLERLTLAAVCRRLLAAGIPSPAGNTHWSRAMIHTMLLNPAYAGKAIYGRRRCIPWQPPCTRPAGMTACRSVPTGRFRHRPISTSPSPCRRSWMTGCSRARRSSSRRTGAAAVSAWRACGTCCAGCSSARSAGMASRATTTGPGIAITAAAAPIAAGSTASSAATPGWSRSSRSMRPSGTRSAGC